MRPTWLLSGQKDGSVVRRPVLFGAAPTEIVGMLARYLRVTEAAVIGEGNEINDNTLYRSQNPRVKKFHVSYGCHEKAKITRSDM